MILVYSLCASIATTQYWPVAVMGFPLVVFGLGLVRWSDFQNQVKDTIGVVLGRR